MKKFNFSRLSLSQQFLLVSMGTIALILIGVSSYMVKTSVRSKADQLQVMANGRSSAVIEKIDRNFYERFGDVQAFAFNKLAVEAASSRMRNDEIDQFINTMVSYYVLYDLMMICDANGRVITANTKDKYGKLVKTDFLIGKDFSNEDWYRTTVSGTGPEGGAWYSDFTENTDVSRIYNRTGNGMAFAAPIRDSTGTLVGVWYNFANWADVTTGIRQETENVVKESQPGSFILITDRHDVVIDGDDPAMIMKTRASAIRLQANDSFTYQGKNINAADYLVGGKNGTGAYTYKGKSWNALTFVPRPNITFAYLKENLLEFFLVVVLVLLLIAFAFYKLASTISLELTSLKNNIGALSKGQLVDIQESAHQNEIGAMSSAMKHLVTGMRETTQFAKEVGEGNLNVKFTALSDQDVLGHALLTMRDNLVRIRETDQRNEWASNGIAKISEILRSNANGASELYDNIIRFVVRYTGSNQGGIFLRSENTHNDQLNLVCCYAYERKKFVEKQVSIGEGLVGQCFQEQDVIYLTDVPRNYVSITSGLGEATPTAIVLIPLKVNDTTVGVMELASFKQYQEHERTLLEKFAESIASTVSSVQINERTKQLLEQSQHQAEELKAQEEEMRQNMEEMTATQEEMQRKSNESNQVSAELMGIMNALNTTMATIEFRPDGTIVNANENFLHATHYSLNDLKGKNHRMLVPPDVLDSRDYQMFWSRLAAGKSFTGVYKRVSALGETLWLNAIYNPIMDESGRVVKVLKFATDVTSQQEIISRNGFKSALAKA